MDFNLGEDHCDDYRSMHRWDSVALVEARKQIGQLIKKWIQEAKY